MAILPDTVPELSTSLRLTFDIAEIIEAALKGPDITAHDLASKIVDAVGRELGDEELSSFDAD